MFLCFCGYNCSSSSLTTFLNWNFLSWCKSRKLNHFLPNDVVQFSTRKGLCHYVNLKLKKMNVIQNVPSLTTSQCSATNCQYHLYLLLIIWVSFFKHCYSKTQNRIISKTYFRIFCSMIAAISVEILTLFDPWLCNQNYLCVLIDVKIIRHHSIAFLHLRLTFTLRFVRLEIEFPNRFNVVVVVVSSFFHPFWA